MTITRKTLFSLQLPSFKVILQFIYSIYLSTTHLPVCTSNSLIQAFRYLILHDGVGKAQTDEELILDVDVMLRFCDCLNVGFVNTLWTK